MSQELERDLTQTLDVIEGLFSLLDHGLGDIILSDVPKLFETGKRLEEFHSSLASKQLVSDFQEKMIVYFFKRGHLVKPDANRLPRICDHLLLKFLASDRIDLIKAALKGYLRVLSFERLCGAAHEAMQLRLIFTSLSNDLNADESPLLESSFVLTSWLKSLREDAMADLNLDLKICEMLGSEAPLKLLLNMLLLNDDSPIVLKVKNKVTTTLKQKIELQNKPFIVLFAQCVNEQHFSAYPDLLRVLLQSLKSATVFMTYSSESKEWTSVEGFTFDEIVNILKALITMKPISKQVVSTIKFNKTFEPCIWIDIEHALDQL